MKLNAIFAGLFVMGINSTAFAGVLAETGTPYTPKPISVAYAYKIDHKLETKAQVIKAMPSTWKLRLSKQVKFNPTGPITKEDTWLSYIKRITLENQIKTTLDWNTRVATIESLSDNDAKTNPSLVNYAFVEEGSVKDVSLELTEKELTVRDILTSKIPDGWRVKFSKSLDVNQTLVVSKDSTLSNVFRQVANKLSADVKMDYNSKVIEVKKFDYALARNSVNTATETPPIASNAKAIEKSKEIMNRQFAIILDFEKMLKQEGGVTEFERQLTLLPQEQAFLDKAKLSYLNIYSMLKFSDSSKFVNVQNNPIGAKFLELKAYLQTQAKFFNVNAKPFNIAQAMSALNNNNNMVQAPPQVATQPVAPPVFNKVFTLEVEDLSVSRAMKRWAEENQWQFVKDGQMLEYAIDEKKMIQQGGSLKDAISKLVKAINYYSKDTKVTYYVNFSDDGLSRTVMLSDRPFDKPVQAQ